jgi:crotonobetainyl-CoA:carnitine CoA-transferase CaiB-like acyl-CoA transferase
MSGPLTGIKVVDLTSVLMGPYCTLMLGDLGAEVIKVESFQGDSTRYLGPSRSAGMSGPFLYIGRNKKSIVLDLKSKEGRDVVLQLAKEADVFIHSMRPQAIDKLDLSYEQVAAVNNRIIYCGAYGFQKDGPYGNKPAYDDIIQGASGLAAAQGKMAGTPQYMASAIADKTSGLMASNAIMAALYSRERTGEGQNIEVPMFESMVAYTLVEHMYGMTFDPPLGESLYPRVTSTFRKPYRTLDGYISVLIYNDKQWSNFFTMSGRPELKEDVRFCNIHSRTENIDELYHMIDDIMAMKTSQEWIAILGQADIPAMPLYWPEDLLSDPHLQQTGFFKKVDHPTEGKILDIGHPVRFSGFSKQENQMAPRLGQDSVDVLRELGYSPGKIQELLEQGITWCEGTKE